MILQKRVSDYEKYDEVYSILVVRFSGDEEYVIFTEEQVPNVGITGEHWLFYEDQFDRFYF